MYVYVHLKSIHEAYKEQDQAPKLDFMYNY